LNLQKKKVKLAALQLDEAYKIAQKIDNKTELLENYRLHVALDSTRGYFENAFFWKNKYHSIKDELSLEVQPVFPTDIDPLDLNMDAPIEDNKNYPKNNTQKNKWFNSPYILYGTIAAITALLALLIYSLLKTKSYKTQIHFYSIY